MKQRIVFNGYVTVLLVTLMPREFWIPRNFNGYYRESCLTIISTKRDHRIIFKNDSSGIFEGRAIDESEQINLSTSTIGDNRVGVLNNSENDSNFIIITNCEIQEPENQDISYLKLPLIEIQTILPRLKLV